MEVVRTRQDASAGGKKGRQVQSPTDSFGETIPAGSVIGSRTSEGVLRNGADSDGVIAIDHGALRIGCPRRPGWGRHGISYGSFRRAPGLAFSTFLINGHNSSQTRIPFNDTFMRRAKRAAKGVIRLLARWTSERWIPARLHRKAFPTVPHDYDWPPIRENLAVGWFEKEAPTAKRVGEHAFIVRSTGIENADLLVRVASEMMPVLSGLQNVQMYYVTILRERGCAYYVASADDVRGAAAYPLMRPLAVDPDGAYESLYAGVHQSILGEINWRVDTRVYGVQVKQLDRYSAWYGTAEAADKLMGTGYLHDSNADNGGNWECWSGAYRRAHDGVRPVEDGSSCALPGSPVVGLVHLRFCVMDDESPVGLMWRIRDRENFLCVQIGRTRARLWEVKAGRWTGLDVDNSRRIKRGGLHSLQITDDGEHIRIAVDGETRFGGPVACASFAHEPGVGLYSLRADGMIRIRDLEVHPRTVPIPVELDLGKPWAGFRDVDEVFSDTFSGSGELDSRSDQEASLRWRKDEGAGVFERLPGGGLRIRADTANPSPGRTIYTTPWDHTEPAELEIEVLPPGTAQGQGHKGRAGLVFWQDDVNYIIVNSYLDDWVIGRSVSSFFHMNGSEDLFQAVWTNVGDRLFWGIPYRLRIAFDGNRIAVFLNDEHILYRSLTDVDPSFTPLRINRVGLGANWEFGDDTGSIFRKFCARRGLA